MINSTTDYKKWLFAVCLLALPFFLFSQKEEAQNIVPNPSFEEFSSAPIGWYYKGAHFGAVVRYWFAATAASPDAYSPEVRVPRDWREKGFGDMKAKDGKNYVGLTVYGCTNGKPHCREYVEILLAEPLVVGQTYAVEFWINTIDKSLYINNIGMLFTQSPIKIKEDEPILKTPQFKATEVLSPKAGKWKKVVGTFVADVEGEYLTLGSFDTDKNTQSVAPHDSCYNYAYYYFDDIKVYKLPPYLPVPVKEDDLTRIELKEGQTITLKDIYFEFDKDDLMPRSFVELRKLLRILKDHPTMVIEIIGHTDSIGSHAYNKVLSEKRAASCVDFLVENGISAKQLRSTGKGETEPIDNNKYENGRQKNRRVEFKVLKM